MNLYKKEIQKVTVKDIAEAVGVSPATVSRVVNHQGIVKSETQRKVIAAMQELGYSYKEPPTSTVQSGGLVIIIIPSLANPFYGSVLNGIRNSMVRHEYSFLIHEGNIDKHNFEQFTKLIRSKKVKGIITMDYIESSLLKKLSDITCVVQCCEYNENIDLPYISIDDSSAAKSAVDHLIAQGRKRIAFINAPHRYKYARYRLEGYIKALESAGLPIVNDYIVQLPEIGSDLAISAALQLLSLSSPPDAFFVISDVYGAAVLRACHLSNICVPKDVAVVGFDNLEISSILIPALSSVNQPMTQLGFIAAETLIEKLSSPWTPNKKIILETELIVRESSSQ